MVIFRESQPFRGPATHATPSGPLGKIVVADRCEVDRTTKHMNTTDLPVLRTGIRLEPEARRVIARPFIPGGENRVVLIADRVATLSDGEVAVQLDRILQNYGSRHKDIVLILERHYANIANQLNGRDGVSRERRLLLGAYFTNEYSLESVALFNPSIVLHPDQTEMKESQSRFIMSLRACGEGHISSIEFRTGVIDSANGITIDTPTPFAASEDAVSDHLHDKNRFFLKLKEMGAYRPMADPVLEQLTDQFTMDELEQALSSAFRLSRDLTAFHELAEAMRWLAHSSYYLSFPDDSDVSERVIYPVTENESRGIEDARFVRFECADGQVLYYATFTAYNGFTVLPQLLVTTDFKDFKIQPLNGQCAQNKGMALFPRRVDDRYVMISRLDGENLYLLRSDSVLFWNEGQVIQEPKLPWEFVQIGNCGSPLETEAGWLVLTHGVGPMREYWMGAILLDLNDPSKVIGHLKEPLLTPTDDERNGYVPNVIYSCGGMIHNAELILPYGFSDSTTSFARIPLADLLNRLVSS